MQFKRFTQNLEATEEMQMQMETFVYTGFKPAWILLKYNAFYQIGLQIIKEVLINVVMIFFMQTAPDSGQDRQQ